MSTTSLFTYVNNSDIESFLDNQENYENKIAFLGNSGNIATKGNIYGMNEDLSYLTNAEVSSIFENSGDGSNSGNSNEIINNFSSGLLQIRGYNFYDSTLLNDQKVLYIGIPSGFDLTDIQIKLYRYSTTKNRRGSPVHSQRSYKTKSFHEIYGPLGIKIDDNEPINNRRTPLFNIEFIDPSSADFSLNGYDYYKIGGYDNNNDLFYDNFIDYCINTSSGFFNKVNNQLESIKLWQILRHKHNFLCLTKNNKIISTLIRINIEYYIGDSEIFIKI